MLKKSGTAAALFVFALLFGAIQVRASQEELTLFDRGYGYYLALEPEKAAESFRVFLYEFPESSARDAALFWLGRSLVSLHLYEEARQIFDRLKQEIPESPFIRHAEKELEMIGTSDAKKELPNEIQKRVPEIEVLMHEKAETEKILVHITRERDELKSLLEEEKRKMSAMAAEVNRVDGELKEIMDRLQALRKDQGVQGNSIPISENQEHESPGGLQKSPEETRSEQEKQLVSVNTVQESEQEQRNPAADPRKNEQAYPVMQQSSWHTLELIATDETWISVTIDDRDSRERLLKAGARIKWTAKNGFSVKIGNAGGTKVLFNGNDIGPLGAKGKVVRMKLPPLNLSTGRQERSKVL